MQEGEADKPKAEWPYEGVYRVDNKIPIVVFDMYKPGSIRDAVLGHKVGTLVCDEPSSDVKIQAS